MAETAGTDAWLEELELKQKAHHRAVEEVKKQILEDEDLPELDRAVLGATGSPAELERYRAMADKIVESIGEPILKVRGRYGRADRMDDVEGGIIIGPVQASIDYSEICLRDEPRQFRHAGLAVPISPAMTWDDYGKRGVQARFDEELAHSSLHDVESGAGLLPIAGFSPPETDHSGFRVKNVYKQFGSRIEPGSILIGRLAIYEHPQFNEGIHRAMAALEERVAQDEPDRHYVSHVVLG